MKRHPAASVFRDLKLKVAMRNCSVCTEVTNRLKTLVKVSTDSETESISSVWRVWLAGRGTKEHNCFRELFAVPSKGKDKCFLWPEILFLAEHLDYLWELSPQRALHKDVHRSVIYNPSKFKTTHNPLVGAYIKHVLVYLYIHWDVISEKKRGQVTKK